MQGESRYRDGPLSTLSGKGSRGSSATGRDAQEDERGFSNAPSVPQAIEAFTTYV